jgi:cytochrome P450
VAVGVFVHIAKARALAFFLRFAVNPLIATRELHDYYGPHLQLDYPTSTRRNPQRLTAVADAELYRVMLSDPDTWRNVKINFNGIGNNAARRLTYGMTRLTGLRHEHYRRLITPALKRPAVEAMGETMAAIATRAVEAWPRDEPVDLLPLTRQLAQDLASSLLFGDDLGRALPICRMISQGIDASWFLPRPAYLRWLTIAPTQEQMILAWAEEKRGETNPRDLLSILINNPDEKGDPAGATIIGGLTSFLFGAAYDTCQNALAWTLVLLTQHPKLAGDLAAEVDAAWHGEVLDVERLGSLPRLDGVIKEAMRLFPPVPLQFRKATAATQLMGTAMERGSRVLVSAHVIHRDPEVYVDPDRFRPERWLEIKPSPFHYTVYGAGGHMCPGATFGNQMLKVGLATILRRYNVELAPGARVNYRSTITLAPYGRVQIVFRGRDHPAVFRRAEGVINRLVELPALA